MTAARPGAAIGGIFLATRNVPRLVAWYRGLGLPVDDQGLCMVGPDGRPAKPPLALVFSIQQATGELPPTGGDLREEPYGRQRAMLNLRVAGLDAVVAGLRKGGHEVAGPKGDEHGRFAWAKDPDGNLVELWEPAD
jgi:catechol 2,3-dioxygenase-like lactoylglutathione lyase family enzyme